MRILVFLPAMLLVMASARAETLTGSVEAIDGDTLKVGGKVVRLAGIDAPDIDQTCQFNGQDVNCGEIARDALLDLITATDVICEIRSDDTATPATSHLYVRWLRCQRQHGLHRLGAAGTG